jgi:hypothetical protein
VLRTLLLLPAVAQTVATGRRVIYGRSHSHHNTTTSNIHRPQTVRNVCKQFHRLERCTESRRMNNQSAGHVERHAYRRVMTP